MKIYHCILSHKWRAKYAHHFHLLFEIDILGTHLEILLQFATYSLYFLVKLSAPIPINQVVNRQVLPSFVTWIIDVVSSGHDGVRIFQNLYTKAAVENSGRFLR